LFTGPTSQVFPTYTLILIQQKNPFANEPDEKSEAKRRENRYEKAPKNFIQLHRLSDAQPALRTFRFVMDCDYPECDSSLCGLVWLWTFAATMSFPPRFFPCVREKSDDRFALRNTTLKHTNATSDLKSQVPGSLATCHLFSQKTHLCACCGCATSRLL